MRRIVIVIIILFAVAFIVFSLTELQNILIVLQKSNGVFLFVAFLFEIVCLVNTSFTFGALYKLAGLNETRKQIFLMTAAANFVNMVAPSGGVGGIAILLDEAHRRNIPSARVLVVGMFYLLYEYAALFCVLILGYFVLIKRNLLNAGEVIAAVFLLILSIAISLLLMLGYRSSNRLGDLLAKLSKFFNHFFRPILHRDILVIKNAYKFAEEIKQGICGIQASRMNLILPFLFTLNNKFLLACILLSSFLAVNTPFSIGTIIGGLSISYLFFYASPTPSGVGFVEGVLPSALNDLSVPFTEAVLITLVFRAMTVWLPLAVGAIAFHVLQNQSKTEIN